MSDEVFDTLVQTARTAVQEAQSRAVDVVSPSSIAFAGARDRGLTTP